MLTECCCCDWIPFTFVKIVKRGKLRLECATLGGTFYGYTISEGKELKLDAMCSELRLRGELSKLFENKKCGEMTFLLCDLFA